jgi:hypothetical protein
MCPEIDWASANRASDDFGSGGELCAPIAGDFDAEWVVLFGDPGVQLTVGSTQLPATCL